MNDEHLLSEMPCPHRTDVPISKIIGTKCSIRGKLLWVYGCSEFGKCTLVPSSNQTSYKSCVNCPIRLSLGEET